MGGAFMEFLSLNFKWSTSQALPQFLQGGQSWEAYISSHANEVPDLVLIGVYSGMGQFPPSWGPPFLLCRAEIGTSTNLDGGAEVIKRDEPGRHLLSTELGTQKPEPRPHSFSLCKLGPTF